MSHSLPAWLIKSDSVPVGLLKRQAPTSLKPWVWPRNPLTPAWQQRLPWLLAISLISGIAFYDSWLSMVSIWRRSDTYAHGFLVLPLALLLLWQQRQTLARQTPQDGWLALPALLILSVLWLAAKSVGILVGEQLMTVALLICAIAAIVGRAVVLHSHFALLLLLLMVPFGEDWVPALMAFTAQFVVAGLRLLGISVYQEGLHFTLSSGHWSVVEACSGIRYLIASLTLGAVYAHHSYQQPRKRLLFMLVAALLPILANGLRALGIVLLGHVSNRQLASGVDHLVYGWLFFGLVMAALFYLGQQWRDQPCPISAGHPSTSPPSTGHDHPALPVLVVLTLLAAPLGQRWLLPQLPPPPASHYPSNALPLSQPWPSRAAPNQLWQPALDAAAIVDQRVFHYHALPVVLHWASFNQQANDNDWIRNPPLGIQPPSEQWRIIERHSRSQQDAQQQPISIDETLLQTPQGRWLVWQWYRIGSAQTANPYRAKGLQLLNRWRGQPQAEGLMLLSSPMSDDDPAAARQRLQAWWQAAQQSHNPQTQ